MITRRIWGANTISQEHQGSATRRGSCALPQELCPGNVDADVIRVRRQHLQGRWQTQVQQHLGAAMGVT